MSKMPMINLENSSLTKNNATLLVDTASSVNIIKVKSLDPRVWINKRRIYNLIGIGKDMVNTLGETKFIIKGLETPFQVVLDSFPIQQDGILGVEALRQHHAVLNFIDNCLHLGEQDFPLLSHATISLPARTRAVVQLVLKNTNLKECYIPRLSCGPEIFSGECLTVNNNWIARIFMVNSSNNNVHLTVPPVELEEYEVAPSSSESVKNTKDESKKQAKRLVEIQKLFNLNDLNEEERESLIPLFFEFAYQFRLPEDQLGATNVAKQKILTTDDKPINIKQYRYPRIHTDEIRKQTDELLASGIVQPSVSP